MGKRLALFLGCMTLGVFAENALFDYTQLNEDSPNSAFIRRFSDSRSFICYSDKKVNLQLNVGLASKGFSSDREIERQYLSKFGTLLNWESAKNYLQLNVGTEDKSGYRRIYVSIGRPLFDSNREQKHLVVDLVNGKKVDIFRFGPIPDFPFNTKARRKPFFYYQVAGEPRYECGPIDQPD